MSLSNFEVTVENDELTIFDIKRADFFKYQMHDGKPISKEDHRLQKALFHEKQTIIENCLFGVDIIPHSVKICRLRLWIELLKNAYYKESTDYTELETLPNIDINIKQGNALLSRFGLDTDVSKALKKFKYKPKEYRQKVALYKNEKDREAKRELLEIFKEIKNDFSEQIFSNDKRVVALRKLRGDLFNLKNQSNLFGESDDERKKRLERQAVLERNISKKAKQLADARADVVYKNSFEWRFEFPEVLDNDGNFLGFDIVIGNPPYISAIDLKKSLSEDVYQQLKKDYETAKGAVDLFIYFFEKGLNLLKNSSSLMYITPNRYLSANYGEALREFLYNNAQLNEIIDYSSVKVFKEVSTYPIITSLTKQSDLGVNYPVKTGKYNQEKDLIEFKTTSSEKLNFLEGYIWGYLLNDKLPITEYVVRQSVSITECARINATSTASEAEDYHKLINQKSGWKLVNTGTIDRYENLWGKVQLTDKGEKFLTPYLPKDSVQISQNRKDLYASTKIVVAKIALVTEAFLDESGDFASINTNCFHTFNDQFNKKYVLAWLNSTLFQYMFECFFEGLKMQGGYMSYSSPYLSKMFIKRISKPEQAPFIALVNQILASKKQGKPTYELENGDLLP